MKKIIAILFCQLSLLNASAQETIILGEPGKHKSKIDARKEIYKIVVDGLPTSTSKYAPKGVSGGQKEIVWNAIELRNATPRIDLPSGIEFNIERINEETFTKELGIRPKLSQKGGKYEFRSVLNSGLNTFKVTCTLDDLDLYTDTIYIHRNVIPNLFVLSIGIPYKGVTDLYDLTLTVNDASEFTETLRNTQKELYGEIYYKVLNTPEMTASSRILDGIHEFIQEAENKYRLSEDDVFILYISSHGILDKENEQFSIPFSDFNITTPKFRKNTSLTFEDLKSSYLSRLAQKCKLITIVDACHSGTINESYMGDNHTEADRKVNAIIQQQIIQQTPGIIQITSSSGDQVSFVHGNWGLSALAKGMIDIIYDERYDSDKDGAISFRELKNSLPGKVNDLVRSAYGTSDRNGNPRNQIPELKAVGINEDYPLFKVGKK